jgi:DNA-binding response OmpR family regulator
MTNPTSNICFANNSAATFAPGVLSWSLRRRLQRRWSTKTIADPMLILILSDINMPGMSGLDMLPKVKAARPNVPVIMITAYGDEATKKRAAELGAAGLLVKPIDFGLLREKIDERLQRAA